jgi:hypothetical protein
MAKKYFLLFMLVMVAMLYSKGQDIIHKNDTSTIRAKILEVGVNEIKFKKYDNPDGPIYTIKKADVSIIVYENGNVDVITQPKMVMGKPVNLNQYKRNIISVYLLDFLIDRLTVSYEHIFYDGYLGVNVPLSFGVSPQSNNTFVTGADVNFYPKGQGKWSYFIGPKLRFGDYGEVLKYSHNDSFVSFMVNNGIAFAPRSGFRFVLGGGIGVLSKSTNMPHSNNYYSRRHQSINNQIMPWGTVNLNIGFSF